MHKLLFFALPLSFGLGFASATSPLEDRLVTPVAEAEWLIKPLKAGAVISLGFEYYILGPNDAPNSASFSFVCDRREPGKISATLFPFKGSYNNQQDDIPVLFERSSNASESSSLLLKWGNGYRYIFLNPATEVKKLVEYFKRQRAEGSESLDVLFSGDFYGKTDTLLKVSVGLSKFPEAYSLFESACTAPL